MNLKMTALSIFAFLLLSIKANAILLSIPNQPNDIKSNADYKKENIDQSKLIAFNNLVSQQTFPNQLDKSENNELKPLPLRADFWFAFIAIGGLVAMRLLRNKLVVK